MMGDIKTPNDFLNERLRECMQVVDPFISSAIRECADANITHHILAITFSIVASTMSMQSAEMLPDVTPRDFVRRWILMLVENRPESIQHPEWFAELDRIIEELDGHLSQEQP